MKIIWSPLAIERASEILEYIAQDNPNVAAKWVETLFEKVGVLQSSPNSGEIVPETQSDDICEIVYGNYRIIYAVLKNKACILTVRHDRQILPTEEITI